MADITTSVLADSIKTLYIQDYLLAAQPRLYWQQLAWVFEEMGARRGSAIAFPIYEDLAEQTSTLSEASDPTAITFADTEFSMSFAEYGAVVRQTELLSATAYTDIEKAIAEQVGYNLANSLDKIIRKYFVQGSHVLYASGATRTGLKRGDKVNWNLVNRGVQMARSRNMPTFEDGFYVTVVRPEVIYDLMNDTVVQNAFVQNENQRLWNGEVGSIAGLRFVSSSNGRVFYGAGSSEVANDTDGAVAAGATSFDVTSATGFAVGDYITIGSLETGSTEYSTTELVQITGISSNTLTVVGEGNTQSNAGVKYAHADAEAVTRAPNVHAIPLVGPMSVAHAASDRTGPLGQLRFTGPFDALGRLYNAGWYGLWAFGRPSEKWLLRLECTSSY